MDRIISGLAGAAIHEQETTTAHQAMFSAPTTRDTSNFVCISGSYPDMIRWSENNMENISLYFFNRFISLGSNEGSLLVLNEK